jgi:C4-dicarboxylate-specific signal transduction histidine kinase
MFSVQAESKSITLEADIPEDLPAVKADGSSLEQVFGNLLINAMDAVEPGNGRIRLEASRENGRLNVSVTDNGHGIPEEHLGSIFDPFFTTKEVGKGTGLGLAVVYGIVKDLGGSISVENGRGAAFKLSLPAAREQAEAGAHE